MFTQSLHNISSVGAEESGQQIIVADWPRRDLSSAGVGRDSFGSRSNGFFQFFHKLGLLQVQPDRLSRECIWVMDPQGDSTPSYSKAECCLIPRKTEDEILLDAAEEEELLWAGGSALP
jgi:hypothetical protein